MRNPDTAAVDLGGTSLRLAVTDVNGKLVEWERTAVSPAKLPAVLKKIWKEMGWAKAGRLIVGSKGIWILAERRWLKKSLHSLAQEVRVMSDVELAMHGAFAGQKQTSDRIFIVSGTGSIAIGLSKTGTLFRAGGLGPMKGDEGSGWWIGNEYLKRTHQSVKKFSSPAIIRITADLAKKVWTNAPRNPLCSTIIQEAQTHLANLILDVSRQMKARAPLSLSWGGSWMLDKHFRAGVLAIVHQKIRRNLKLAPPQSPPARAAARHPDDIPQGLQHIPSRG